MYVYTFFFSYIIVRILFNCWWWWWDGSGGHFIFNSLCCDVHHHTISLLPTQSWLHSTRAIILLVTYPNNHKNVEKREKCETLFWQKIRPPHGSSPSPQLCAFINTALYIIPIIDQLIVQCEILQSGAWIVENQQPKFSVRKNKEKTKPSKPPKVPTRCTGWHPPSSITNLCSENRQSNPFMCTLWSYFMAFWRWWHFFFHRHHLLKISSLSTAWAFPLRPKSFPSTISTSF